MELEENATGRDRIARMLAAVGLTLAAADMLRKGRRFTGALVGVGALALGYQVATESSDLSETLDADVLGSDEQTETGQLTCALCGEPIVPGQRRGPNEDDETVHLDCREAAAEVGD